MQETVFNIQRYCVNAGPVLPSQPYQLLSCLYNIEEER